MAQDLSTFTRPNIQSVDLVLTAGQRAEILPDDLRLDGETRWIKRVIFTEHTLADMAVPPAVDSTFLPQLVGRWYVRGRQEKSGTLRQVHYFDSQAWERHNPQFSAAAGQKVLQLAWRLDHTIEVQHGQGVYVDMFNPPTTAVGVWPAGGAPSFLVALHGYGASTGWNRCLHLLATVGQTPGGGGAGVTLENGPGADGRNDFGETVIVDRITIHSDDLLLNTTDTRALNHLRMGIRIETSGVVLTGRSAGDWAPVIMYGSHRNLAGRVAIMEPLGVPLVVGTDESIGLELQNTNAAAVTVRAQVGVVSLVKR